MATCPAALIYTSKPTAQCGVTNAMFVVPMVRINGIPQDLPIGMKLDPSVLPESSTGGTTLTVATPVIALDTSASIPTSVVGTDNFLLANPTPTGGGWMLVEGTTNKYVPFYQF